VNKFYNNNWILASCNNITDPRINARRWTILDCDHHIMTECVNYVRPNVQKLNHTHFGRQHLAGTYKLCKFVSRV